MFYARMIVPKKFGKLKTQTSKQRASGPFGF